MRATSASGSRRAPTLLIRGRSVGPELEASREEEIEAFRRERLHSLEARRDSLQREIEVLRKAREHAAPDLSSFDPLDVIVANKRVELAGINVEVATENVAVSNTILDRYGQFGAAQVVAELRAATDSIEGGGGPREVVGGSADQ